MRKKACRVKCAVRAHRCGGEGVKGALECAQGTRGGGRKESSLAGRRTIERSEDARGVAGRAASTGRVDSGIQEKCKHPWDSSASQCLGCGVMWRG